MDLPPLSGIVSRSRSLIYKLVFGLWKAWFHRAELFPLYRLHHHPGMGIFPILFFIHALGW